MNTFKQKLFVFITLSTVFLIYSVTLYLSESQQTEVPSALAQQGKTLWQEKNCISCHQLYGLGGHLGPDLTNIYALRSEEHIKAFLKSGTPVMPDFELTEQEIQAFLAFFEYTNTTGVSNPSSFKKHIDGTITQK